MAENFIVSVIINARDNLSQTLTGISGKLATTSAKIKGLSDKLSGVGSFINTRFTLPLTVAAGLSIRSFDQQAQAIEQVRVGLVSTGNAAKKTVDELVAASSALEEKTIFGDEQILGGVSAQLLRFGKISGEQFDRTQKAVLDVATRIAGLRGSSVDLTGTATQLGKALNDPVKNLSALSRMGIQFTEKQKKVIKSLVESNNLITAQKVILKELESKFGGSAEAAAKAGAGGFKQFLNTLDNLMETIGEFLYEILTPFIETLKEVTKRLDEFFKANPKIAKMAIVIAALVAAIGLLLASLAGIGFILSAASAGFTLIAGSIGTITAAIAGLTAAIIALVKLGPGIADFIKNKLTPIYAHEASFSKYYGERGLTGKKLREVKEPFIERLKLADIGLKTTVMPALQSQSLKTTVMPIPSMGMQRGQTDINIKLTAPDFLKATSGSSTSKGNGSNVKIFSEGYLGNTQMIPGLR